MSIEDPDLAHGREIWGRVKPMLEAAMLDVHPDPEWPDLPDAEATKEEYTVAPVIGLAGHWEIWCPGVVIVHASGQKVRAAMEWPGGPFQVGRWEDRETALDVAEMMNNARSSRLSRQAQPVQRRIRV